MEVPFYLSFEEFQSQFKIDFVKISSDNTNITLIEYYENIKTHYENVLHNCKNAKTCKRNNLLQCFIKNSK